jgi:hypothetical protein
LRIALTDSEVEIESAIDRFIATARPADRAMEPGYYQRDRQFEKELSESGFLDVAGISELGLAGAALIVEAVAKLPIAAEVGATAFLGPLVGKVREGPLALARRADAPIRFLEKPGSLLFDDGQHIRLLDTSDVEIQVVHGVFGFPFGKLVDPLVTVSAPVLDLDPTEFRRRWRLALCFEAIGAMQAALDMTVEYVKVRHQFGRPLGAFQSIQHRLSECAVSIASTRLLSRAAMAGGDAARACGFAQDTIARVAYETHQFHGAIGLTLEHSLHYLTYRLRVLQGELGGASEQYSAGISPELV